MIQPDSDENMYCILVQNTAPLYTKITGGRLIYLRGWKSQQPRGDRARELPAEVSLEGSDDPTSASGHAHSCLQTSVTHK